MRAYEFIFEGYKEAQTEFTQLASPDEVLTTINAYKALVNKNQVQGNERNIDFWRKQGWVNFKKFVSDTQVIPTQTQLKRSKIVGKSITLREDSDWLIVIPLDKDASCFHGKGSDWCTTKQFQSYFEDYFYDKKVVLIYCLQKNTGGMWAIAGHKQLDKMEIFDKNDNSVDEQLFIKQTGLDAKTLVDKALHTHSPAIDNSRVAYNQAIEKINNLIQHDITERNPEIEKLLLFTKIAYYIQRYVKKLAYPGKRIELPKELRIPMLHVYPQSIEFLKNTTEHEQYIVVKSKLTYFTLINNPTENIGEYVVNRNGMMIRLVPREMPNYRQLCFLAVSENGKALQFIPSNIIDYEMCEIAVNEAGRLLIFVPEKFRDYNLCKKALVSSVNVLEHVLPNNLTPEEYINLCKFVLNKDGGALTYIPREFRIYDLCEKAIENDPASLQYVPEDLPGYEQLKQYAEQLIGD